MSVRLRNFSAAEKIAARNFACLFDYYRAGSSPILVNFGSRGVTAAAPMGDFGGLHASERLAGQSELVAPCRGICLLLTHLLLLLFGKGH